MNFNGEAFLRETLDALLPEVREDDEVLLLDNASEDGSLEVLAGSYPRVRALLLEENRGPGAARNAGFRRAAHDRILFLDNDVSLNRGCTELLLDELQRAPAAIAAMPAVLLAADDAIVQYDGADAHYLGTMSLRGAGRPAAGMPLETKRLGSLITACFLLDRSRWTGGEPFDESIFIYFDDHDFALQARLLGYEILGVPPAGPTRLVAGRTLRQSLPSRTPPGGLTRQ